MRCKNKVVNVFGIIYNDTTQTAQMGKLRCIITNNEGGKTLSVDNGEIQFSFGFEQIEEFFRGDYRRKK